MISTLFYDRRKEAKSVETNKRKNPDRRSQENEVLPEQRRLASQIRRYERDSFKVPVRLKTKDSEVSGYTQDISPEGLLVFSDVSLNPGTPMSLQFFFGEFFWALNISGQVLFCRLVGKEGTARHAIGIKFSGIRDFEKAILTSSVTELRQHPDTYQRSLLNIRVSTDTLSQEAADISLIIPRPLEEIPGVIRKSAIHASKIIGWGSYLPANEISSQDISDRVKSSGFRNVGKVVETLTGIKSRRYDSHDRYPSDLAADASYKALKNAGMDAKDLDVIIFFGISRDFHEPATANVVQEKIGARSAYAFDIANACNGFVSAVDLLDSLIASGRCETGLVATGELISPYIDWEPKSKEDFKHSIFGYTICDAGGAAVLTRTNRGDDRGIRARWFLNDGYHWRLAIAGTMEEANSYGKFFKSKGLELEQASIQRMPEGIKEVLDLLQWSIEDIDLVIPHQIPISIQQNLYEKALGLPAEKLFWTFPEYGNNATASMPVAVCEAIKQGRIKPGDKVLLLGAAAGFSGGIVGLVF